MAEVKALIKKGNVNKIKLKKGDKTVFEFPVNIGVLGIAGAAVSSTLLWLL